MRSTIGEIVDVLLPYSNKVETTMVGGLPFVKAYLSGRNNTTKAIMYIVQMSSHIYSLCDDYDHPIGDNYFATGSTLVPFISEKEIISQWFENNKYEKEYHIHTNISYNEFIEYTYERLWYYDIIRFNPKNKKIIFSELGFNNIKIRKTIDKSFESNNCNSNTIGDLIELVMKRGKSFSLEGLKQKEINCVFSKLKSIGIISTIKHDMITMISFERKA